MTRITLNDPWFFGRWHEAGFRKADMSSCMYHSPLYRPVITYIILPFLYVVCILFERAQKAFPALVMRLIGVIVFLMTLCCLHSVWAEPKGFPAALIMGFIGVIVFLITCWFTYLVYDLF